MKLTAADTVGIRPIVAQALAAGSQIDIAQVHDFVSSITTKPRGHDHVLAILFYGSCLSPGMEHPSSTPDYFVVVDSYLGFYGRKRQAFLNRWLPPNIYRYRESKYSVTSLADLSSATGERANDVYLMGRFSKRMALCYFKDETARQAIIDVSALAAAEVLRRSLPLIEEEVTLDQIIFMALKLSYLGDIRVEADDKLQKIFQTNAEYYRELYSKLLQNFIQKFDWIKVVADPNHPGATLYNITPEPLAKAASLRFIRKSRIRACLRWPKFALTIDNWVDYIVAKIERAQGIQIQLTERERRWPFIFTWKYIWMLRRRNILK